MNIPAGWTKKDESLIFTVSCKNFADALALLNSIGDIAEKQQHHPDLGIRNYNEVFVSTTTHDAGGLTEKDYELAKDISALI